MEARYAFRTSQLLDECQMAPEIFEQVIPRLYVFMTPFVTTFQGHCQLIDKIPNKWAKYLTIDLLTPCILVHECQGKSQEIRYLPLS